MRTASAGGKDPFSINRLTLLYEARSTSIDNVESGSLIELRKAFSRIF